MPVQVPIKNGLLMAELGSVLTDPTTVGTPPSGQVVIYTDLAGAMRIRNSSNTEVTLGSGGGTPSLNFKFATSSPATGQFTANHTTPSTVSSISFNGSDPLNSFISQLAVNDLILIIDSSNKSAVFAIDSTYASNTFSVTYICGDMTAFVNAATFGFAFYDQNTFDPHSPTAIGDVAPAPTLEATVFGGISPGKATFENDDANNFAVLIKKSDGSIALKIQGGAYSQVTPIVYSDGNNLYFGCTNGGYVKLDDTVGQLLLQGGLLYVGHLLGQGNVTFNNLGTSDPALTGRVWTTADGILVLSGATVGMAICTFDSGWTANVDAGRKTGSIPSNTDLEAMVSTLNGVYGGFGDAFVIVAEQVKAIKAGLIAKLLPNA